MSHSFIYILVIVDKKKCLLTLNNSTVQKYSIETNLY